MIELHIHPISLIQAKYLNPPCVGKIIIGPDLLSAVRYAVVISV